MIFRILLGAPVEPHVASQIRWYVESEARRFTEDIVELETGSKLAVSIGYIRYRLTDAQASLVNFR